MSLLEAALEYAQYGWHVLPVHTALPGGKCSCNKECSNPGKHPRTQNGHMDATTDEGQIRQWWKMWPTANIGINCRMSGLVTIDIDPHKGGTESYGDLKAQHGYSLIDTVSSDTGGGGNHFVFRAPPGIHIGDVACSDRYTGPLGRGVDVRAMGYFIAPPSNHVSGNNYEWYADCSPADRPPAPLPDALIDLLGPKPYEQHEPLNMADILDGVPSGERDWKLFLAAAKLRGAGVPIDWAYRLVEDAAANCDPPFPAKEARKKVDSAYKRYPEGKAAIVAPPPQEALTGEDLFIWASQLDNLPELEWLVDGIAHMNGMGLLVGAFGSYKTFVMLDMACCIATGKPWHGREVRQGPVVYAFGEGLRGLKHRVRAWELANKRTVTDLAFVPRAIQMMQPLDVDLLLDRIRAEMSDPPIAVFVDTLARAMSGGNENETKDMGMVVESADRIARETGAAVWFAHHPRKDGDTYRGSTALPGAVEAMILAQKKPGGIVRLSCEKLKDAEEFEPFELALTQYGQSLAVETPNTYQMMKASIAAMVGQKKKAYDALAQFGDEGARRIDWAKAAEMIGKDNEPTTTFGTCQKEFSLARVVEKVEDKWRIVKIDQSREQFTAQTIDQSREQIGNFESIPPYPRDTPEYPRGGMGNEYPRTPAAFNKAGVLGVLPGDEEEGVDDDPIR